MHHTYTHARLVKWVAQDGGASGGGVKPSNSERVDAQARAAAEEEEGMGAEGPADAPGLLLAMEGRPPGFRGK